MDVGFKGVITDRMLVQGHLIVVAADVEGFTGQGYPGRATAAYVELI